MGKVKIDRWVGLLVGLVLLAAALWALFFFKLKPPVEEEVELVRPLKTVVVAPTGSTKGRVFPGRVSATRKVKMAFEVAGTVIELPGNKGDKVVKGQLLARLDPSDYQNELNAAVAERTRAEAHRDRIAKAAKSGAVALQDLTDAEAALGVAEATVNVRRKALADTELRARFDGVIADRFVENFENVRAKQDIISLQDVSSVEIEVNLPEERVVWSRTDKDRYRFVATFDYLPGREFDVTLKEYVTEADPVTQTYQVTFAMAAPEDVLILPGMTATIEEWQLDVGDDEAVLAAPLAAIGIDGDGQYYVWRVKESGEDEYVVRRVDVEVASMEGEVITITDGLKRNDRVAAAGVSFLKEGQKVRLTESEQGGQ